MYAYVGNDPMNFTDPLGLVKADEEVVVKGDFLRGGSLNGSGFSFGGYGAFIQGLGVLSGGDTKGNQSIAKAKKRNPNAAVVAVTATRGTLSLTARQFLDSLFLGPGRLASAFGGSGFGEGSGGRGKSKLPACVDQSIPIDAAVKEFTFVFVTGLSFAKAKLFQNGIQIGTFKAVSILGGAELSVGFVLTRFSAADIEGGQKRSDGSILVGGGAANASSGVFGLNIFISPEAEIGGGVGVGLGIGASGGLILINFRFTCN